MQLRTTQQLRPSYRAQQQCPPPTKSNNDLCLHPDDANNKVFHAIRRAFLAVDNRAMTIKDLTDLTMANGLICLNPSAASQAITSYLRSHTHRCEVEQDQPLLLKHTLSGSTADDVLLPALYSRSGGSRLDAGPSRSTNFRRGTTVWYLSRATGASCPFARAGIRLSQHTQSCGHKRKRRGISRSSQEPLSDRDSHSEEDDSFSDSDSEHEAPPPKQRLTLKLPTLAQLKSRQNTTFVPGLPPDPHRSPSIPLSLDYLSYNPRRSPSLPYSIRSGASPPPESDEEMVHSSDIEMDDEDDDISVMIFDEDDDNDDDNDDDHGFSSSELDPDEGESPGPRSPSAPPLHTVLVKEEPTDVQGILDHWEDSDLHTAKFSTFDTPDPTIIKHDDSFPDFLEWDKAWSSSPSASASPPIKQEEEPLSLSFSGPSFSTWRQPDLSSPLSPVGLFLDEPAHDYPAIVSDPALPQSLTTLINELSVSSPPVACVSPSDTRIKNGKQADVVIVKTCEPCEPEICATQVEGISVYQTGLGPHTLLRRIDTDFVNLSPILEYAQSPHPVLTTISGATVVIKGSLHVQGVWVPLSAARAYVRDHPLRNSRDAAIVDLFFSDLLVERFPSALRQFVLSERQVTGQFGKSFGESERAASPAAITLSAMSLTSRTKDDASEPHQHAHQLSPLAPLSLSPSLPPPPLSATEEQMFDEICVNLEWENDKPERYSSPPSSPLSSCPPSPELAPLSLPLPSHTRTESTGSDKPLRRSKRVADAKAARIRTRSMRA